MSIKKWFPAVLLGAGLLSLALLPAQADSTTKKTEDKDKADTKDKVEPKADAAKAALAGKEVQFVFKDTPVAKAIEEIAKKSGYSIKLHDPDGKMKDKKVTLDTGKTTFWDALTQFCEKAGLNDDDPNRLKAQAIRPLPGGGIKPLPPVKIQPAPLPKKEEKKQEKQQNAADADKPVQAPAVQAQAIPVQANPGAKPLPAPGGGPAIAPAPGAPVAWVPVEQGQIVLVPAKAPKAVDPKTSIRVRQADNKSLAAPADKDHFVLFLELTVEPRLRWHNLGAIKLTKALDNNDQKLESVEFKPNVRPMPRPLPAPLPVNPPAAQALPARQAQALPAKPAGGPPAALPAQPAAGGGAAGGGVAVMPAFVGWMGSTNGLSRFTPLQFKKDKKETKSFKELTGTVEASVLTAAEAMITADKVMKLAGKSAKGKKGGEIAVSKVTKEKDGTIVIEFTLELPEKVQPEYQVNIPIPADAIPAPQVRPLPVNPGGPGGGLAPPPAVKGAKQANAADEVKPVQGVAVPAADAKPVQGGGVAGGPAIAVPMQPAVQRFAMQGLTLQDDKGKTIYGQITYDFNKLKGIKPNQKKFDLVARYKAGKGMPAEPTKLVFTGRPIVEVKVPFTLKNVEVVSTEVK